MTPDSTYAASPEALFRFTVVSQVLSLEAAGEKLALPFRSVAAAEHVCLDGTRRLVGKRTIYRWLAAFRERGIEGLEIAGRPLCEGSKVLEEKFLYFLRERSRRPGLVSRRRRGDQHARLRRPTSLLASALAVRQPAAGILQGCRRRIPRRARRASSAELPGPFGPLAALQPPKPPEEESTFWWSQTSPRPSPSEST
jgi:hypothetical protein